MPDPWCKQWRFTCGGPQLRSLLIADFICLKLGDLKVPQVKPAVAPKSVAEHEKTKDTLFY